MDRNGENREDLDLWRYEIDELFTLIADRISVFRRFYVLSVFSWIHNRFVWDFSNFTDLPKGLRKQLGDLFYVNPKLEPSARHVSKDRSVKYLFKSDDNYPVESVFIPFKNRASLCVSSQVGCKFNCDFCYSAKYGFKRDLTVNEMLSQVYLTQKRERRKITHIVFMGSGEPLDNYDNLLKSIRILNSKEGQSISLRRMTISTIGIPDKIVDIANNLPQINVALSLHAAISSKRDKIIPANKIYPLEKVLNSLEIYQKKTNRQITFEYVILDGFNTLNEDISAMRKLSKRFDCHYNLIPVNSIGADMQTARKNAFSFLYKLRKQGIKKASVRNSRGSDILAACGQLLFDDMHSCKN